MKRFIIDLLVIAACFFLQTRLFGQLPLAGVYPNLLLIVTVAAGYLRGRRAAMAVGLVCGLLTDFMYGDIIGFYALFYLYIGYGNGMVHRYYFHDDLATPLILIGVSDFLYNLAVYLTQYLLRSRLDIFYYIRNIMLPELIYTLLVSVVLYKLLHNLNRFLQRFERKEE